MQNFITNICKLRREERRKEKNIIIEVRSKKEKEFIFFNRKPMVNNIVSS